jgi:ribose/xylose/arabinose/galactoside ABC-type transport system permease subunit
MITKLPSEEVALPSDSNLVTERPSRLYYRVVHSRAFRYGLSFVLFVLTSICLAVFWAPAADSLPGLVAKLITQILRHGIVFCLLALGASLVVATSEIDLSSLGVATISGVVFAIVVSHFDPAQLYLAVPIAVLAALVSSLLSGFLVSYCVVDLHAPSLIFTWAIGGIYMLVSILLTSLASPSVVHSVSGVALAWETSMSSWEFGGGYFKLSLFVLILTIIVISGTNLPHRAAAVGGNANSAMYSGVLPKRVLRECYISNAVLAGIAGIFQVLIIGEGGTTDLTFSINGLIPIAIALLGGTALSGGYLSLWSVVFAAFFWSAASLLGPILPVLKSVQAEMGQALFYLIFLIVAVLFGSALAPPAPKVYAEKENT